MTEIHEPAVCTDLAIRDVDAILIEVPPADPVSPVSRRHIILVTVTTAGGISGTGFTSTVGTGGHAVFELVRQDLAPRVIGRDAMAVEAIWDDLFWHSHGTARGAVTGMAMATIDIALWDIRGKATETALWRLAGGHCDRVPVYNAESGWIDLEVDQLVAGAQAFRASGWGGMKMKVGKPSPHEDRERVAAVREALGPNIDLMVDANQALTVAEAVRLAGLLEPYDLRWFEEPLAADDVAGYGQLLQMTPIPLAFGESIYSLATFREYLGTGLRGFVQPDITRVGGVTPWLKMAHLAEAFGVKIAPHVRTELSVSLASAVPNGCYIEQHSVLAPLIHTPLQVVDGQAVAPSAPGHGIDWNMDVLDPMRVQ